MNSPGRRALTARSTDRELHPKLAALFRVRLPHHASTEFRNESLGGRVWFVQPGYSSIEGTHSLKAEIGLSGLHGCFGGRVHKAEPD
jgi:hypothetical protein